MSRFLMHYIGGGTDFPFAVIDESCKQCGDHQPMRVIVSDHDFDHNYNESQRHAEIFAHAADVSPHLILLLHQPDEQNVAIYRAARAKVICIEELEDFPKMAADLSIALFDGDAICR